jgi:hypothetical protein
VTKYCKIIVPTFFQFYYNERTIDFQERKAQRE